MGLTYVPSRRGDLLCVDNFLYRKDRGNDQKCSWRCIVKSCRSRIHTSQDEHGEYTEHNHAPDVADIEIRKILGRLRKAAVDEPSTSNSVVVAHAVASIRSRAVIGRLPRRTLLRQQVGNVRRRAGPTLPPQPKTRQDLVIPDFLKVTLKDEPFLLHDSGEGDPNRLVVFATPGNLKLLRDNPEWMLDGTFKTCPLVFHQLYTIHVKLAEGTTVPAVYSLLPSKSRPTYARLLTIIEENLDGFHPDAIHVDFEIAMIRELESFFPSAGIHGCAFHFNQCIWRRIQDDSALREKYMTDGEFALQIRMFSALSFVPPADVVQAFQDLVDSQFVRENEALLADFVSYFARTWVGPNGNQPLFKLEWWNLHVLVLSSMGQTNNQVEGWHSAFAGRLGACHPSVPKFVQHLQLEQSKAEFAVVNSLAQGPDATARKKYRDR